MVKKGRGEGEGVRNVRGDGGGGDNAEGDQNIYHGRASHKQMSNSVTLCT